MPQGEQERVERVQPNPKRCDEERVELDDATAQDVIDALRFVTMAQKSPEERAKLVDALLEFAPETDSDRGIQLITLLIAEGSLKVSLAEEARQP